MATQFHYDAQIRRFLLQFTRMFSHYQVEYGKDDAGLATYLTVPVRYGDPSRQVQHIIQNNSQSSILNVPMMTFHISGLAYARDRVQDPQFVGKVQVRQREYNSSTESYESSQGNAFTVERAMPSPYDLNISLDIWTSNTQQKLQIIEQILPLFNPSLEIQSTDNYLDWTSLSVVELNDVNWSSRQVPVGTDEPIDVATLQFTIPIWISLPARVTKMGVIHKIISSVFDDNDITNFDPLNSDDILLGTRAKITPHGYQLLYIGNQLQLLQANDTEDVGNTSFDPVTTQVSNVSWKAVVEEYGVLESGISQMRLNNEVTGTEIIGTIAYHPTDDNIMLFTADIDTLPANTLNPVDAVVNPLRSGPGILSGTTVFPSAVTGQRYLLTEGTGDINNPASSVASAWKGTNNEQLIANANDIVEYNGSHWEVVFDAFDSSNTDYVTNLTTGLQYKWSGTQWTRSVEGVYPGGEWSLVL
jgi:2C-methyl-D-erythritol 2,4-cyclodiphosphate synthase